MPVLSPHRSSASALAGSYRSTFSSSTIDRPYFSSTNYSPRITSCSERYTTRSYIDSDGRRLFSRSSSITEDGITSRFREETRESSVLRRDSLSRDSGISSIRENSIADFPRRDSSISRSSIVGGGENPRLSAVNVLDSVTELRNKYSPAHYVPACLREKNENISRSKSINDIGLPPILEPKSVNKKNKVNEVNGVLNYNNSIGVFNNSNTSSIITTTTTATTTIATNNDNNKTITMVEDDNGNRTPSVADLKKKFDDKPSAATRTGLNNVSSSVCQLEIEGVKISENRFKKQDNNHAAADALTGGKTALKGVKKPKSSPIAPVVINNSNDCCNNLKKQPIDNDQRQVTATTTNNDESSSDLTAVTSKLDVNNENTNITTGEAAKNGVCNGGDEEATATSGELRKGGASRVNNFASYIPSKDYQQQQKGECVKGSGEEGGVLNGGETESSEEKSEYGKSRFSDISTSPKLNSTSSSSSRSIVSPSITSTLNSSSSNSLSRRSTDRDAIGGYEKYSNSTTAKTLGLNGLKNIGNTCFMNSVIQCLSNTKLLLEYLLKDSYVNDINTTTSGMKGALIKAFAEVIKELWSEDASDRVVNTTSLKSQIQRFAPRFIGYAQQDAQEFLRYLLEGLHEDVNRVKEKPKAIITEIDEKLSDSEKSAESWSRYLRMDNSKIVDYFVGQLKSTLKCTHCGHCSVTFDPFWDLSLPIPQRAGQVRLAQCLDSFTREETLDGDEKPTCSKCKERRKCTKSFTIQKFPKILVIHLKRFSLAERFRGKLSVTVDFPLEGLDMSHYAADHVTPCRYRLYAISNHSGTTYSGHYTAYCRHPYTKSWHEYNDSRVSSISSKSIVSGEAYVLFYEQEGQKSHL